MDGNPWTFWHRAIWSRCSLKLPYFFHMSTSGEAYSLMDFFISCSSISDKTWRSFLVMGWWYSPIGEAKRSFVSAVSCIRSSCLMRWTNPFASPQSSAHFIFPSYSVWDWSISMSARQNCWRCCLRSEGSVVSCFPLSSPFSGWLVFWKTSKSSTARQGDTSASLQFLFKVFDVGDFHWDPSITPQWRYNATNHHVAWYRLTWGGLSKYCTARWHQSVFRQFTPNQVFLPCQQTNWVLKFNSPILSGSLSPLHRDEFAKRSRSRSLSGRRFSLETRCQ